MATIDDLQAEIAALRKDVSSILRGVTLLARHLGAVAKPAEQSSVRVATDAELSGRYGDPKVIVDPRDWNGPSFKGSTMSECPAEFLDMLAVVLDGFADKETDGKKKKYKRDDAAKARGHARRKREQATPTENV